MGTHLIHPGSSTREKFLGDPIETVLEYRKMLMKCTSHARRIGWWLISIAFSVGVVSLHHFLNKNFHLFILLLLPALLASIKLGLRPGMVIIALGTGLSFWSDLVIQIDMPVPMLIANSVLRFTVFALFAWGMHKILELSQALHELSLTDHLTQLANRRAFMIRGNEEIQRARRTRQPFSILFIDIDNFKEVNDAFGHAQGDKLICLIADVLGTRERQADFAARLGGDEFALILFETDGQGALILANKLCSYVKGNAAQAGYSITVSIGVATFQTPPNRFDEAVQKADALMYEVKRSSKNAILHRVF